MGRHGENIRKRIDGRWEARYIQNYDIDGKAVYRSIYGKTYTEAKQKRRIAMAEAMTAPEKEHSWLKATFRRVTEEWMIIKKGKVKESTYAHYANIAEKHLLPELGEVCLSALTAQYLEQFLQKKLTHGRLDGKGGLSNKTVSDMHSILKMILQYAKDSGYTDLDNIHLSVPAGHSPKIQIFSRNEQEKLEKILFSEPVPLHFGILIALYGGLRIGEVCALQWKDFQFEEGTVTINKTIIRIRNMEKDSDVKTKVLVEKPKTECSNRVIPLPDFLLSYFKEASYGKETYLLTGTAHFMEPRVCLDNYKKVLKRAGVKSYNFHALRHTFATRCVENNFDIKSLSEIMGHSNISITMQRYVHPSMEQKREQMNRLSVTVNHGQNHGRNLSGIP